MASDREQYNRALKKWDQLKADEYLSTPPHLGCIAIFCSYVVIDSIGDKPYKKGRRDVKAFRKEAFSLAERFEAHNHRTEVILNAGLTDFDAVLQDPAVSDIVTIGHGDISSVIVSSNDGSTILDWLDVSVAADHLKTGQFIQRQCGNFNRALAIPLGMFSVSRHCDVVAASGIAFKPSGLDHPANDLLGPVTDDIRLQYGDAKETFSY
jgi:hypothetical protein